MLLKKGCYRQYLDANLIARDHFFLPLLLFSLPFVAPLDAVDLLILDLPVSYPMPKPVCDFCASRDSLSWPSRLSSPSYSLIGKSIPLQETSPKLSFVFLNFFWTRCRCEPLPLVSSSLSMISWKRRFAMPAVSGVLSTKRPRALGRSIAGSKVPIALYDSRFWTETASSWRSRAATDDSSSAYPSGCPSPSWNLCRKVLAASFVSSITSRGTDRLGWDSSGVDFVSMLSSALRLD